MFSNSASANSASLGQLGSAYLDTAATTFTPSGCVVIAITALTDLKFSALVSESSGRIFGTDETGKGGDTFSSSDVIPKGTTIYGRWTSVSVSTNDEKCICYTS